MTYVITEQSLPRSLDVQISLSRPQAETRTNLSILCVVGENLGFQPDATRIRYYSTLSAVANDFNSSSEVYNAAVAFFAQSPRANVMAIAEAFTTAQHAKLVAGALSTADITALKLISTGSMKVTVGGTATDVTGMDFTSVTDLASIATVIGNRLTAAGVAASCEVETAPGGDARIAILSTATGVAATMSFPIAAASGTFAATTLRMTQAAGGKALNGYTPGSIADELDNIKAAANANGNYVYGFCLAASLRDVTTQLVAANWAAAQTTIMALVSNEVSALDSGYTTDLGSELKDTSNHRAFALYHDDPTQYPDVSILAYMLSVNYQLQDSTVTAKFKQLPGIPTVQLTESQWTVLQSKGYNTYVSVGNSANTFRDGVTEDPTYFMDSTINLDNFVEDLSVAVFNVFLRNKKVPYTRKGQQLITDGIQSVATQYVYNGTFADRDVTDTTTKAGIKTLPAVDITPTPIQNMSVADRASRIGPPVELICQEAGAIHSVAISVEVVS